MINIELDNVVYPTLQNMIHDPSPFSGQFCRSTNATSVMESVLFARSMNCSSPLMFFGGRKRFIFTHKWQRGNMQIHCKTKMVGWQCRLPTEGEDDKTDAKEPTEASASNFCIIEGPETVQDFAKMQLQEIQDNIRSRRNKIFLHMEEIRRLRIQQRIKNAELGISNNEVEIEMPNFPSFIPFLPPLTSENLKQYYATCFLLITGIIIFGGLLAPTLELKLGLGGTSYKDFISNMNLPLQLSQVDPIVASFSGGAVGVISSLMVVEINNVKQQEQKRCRYCLGTGYLACARCSSTGSLVLVEPVAIVNGSDQPLLPPTTERCPNCLGAGKVMCPTCLCTGTAMASEHDPRIDPFD